MDNNVENSPKIQEINAAIAEISHRVRESLKDLDSSLSNIEYRLKAIRQVSKVKGQAELNDLSELFGRELDAISDKIERASLTSLKASKVRMGELKELAKISLGEAEQGKGFDAQVELLNQKIEMEMKTRKGVASGVLREFAERHGLTRDAVITDLTRSNPLIGTGLKMLFGNSGKQRDPHPKIGMRDLVAQQDLIHRDHLIRQRDDIINGRTDEHGNIIPRKKKKEEDEWIWGKEVKIKKPKAKKGKSSDEDDEWIWGEEVKPKKEKGKGTGKKKAKKEEPEEEKDTTPVVAKRQRDAKGRFIKKAVVPKPEEPVDTTPQIIEAPPKESVVKTLSQPVQSSTYGPGDPDFDAAIRAIAAVREKEKEKEKPQPVVVCDPEVLPQANLKPRGNQFAPKLVQAASETNEVPSEPAKPEVIQRKRDAKGRFVKQPKVEPSTEPDTTPEVVEVKKPTSAVKPQMVLPHDTIVDILLRIEGNTLQLVKDLEKYHREDHQQTDAQLNAAEEARIRIQSPSVAMVHQKVTPPSHDPKKKETLFDRLLNLGKNKGGVLGGGAGATSLLSKVKGFVALAAISVVVDKLIDKFLYKWPVLQAMLRVPVGLGTFGFVGNFINHLNDNINLLMKLVPKLSTMFNSLHLEEPFKRLMPWISSSWESLKQSYLGQLFLKFLDSSKANGSNVNDTIKPAAPPAPPPSSVTNVIKNIPLPFGIPGSIGAATNIIGGGIFGKSSNNINIPQEPGIRNQPVSSPTEVLNNLGLGNTSDLKAPVPPPITINSPDVKMPETKAPAAPPSSIGNSQELPKVINLPKQLTSVPETKVTTNLPKQVSMGSGSFVSSGNQQLDDLMQSIATVEGFYAKGSKPNIPQRANNPGDLIYGKGYVGQENATPYQITGTDGKVRTYAAFPTIEEGWKALKAQIEYTMRKNPNLTISQFIHRYAPAEDSNDPKSYTESVAKKLGVDKDTLLVDAIYPGKGKSGITEPKPVVGASDKIKPLTTPKLNPIIKMSNTKDSSVAPVTAPKMTTAQNIQGQKILNTKANTEAIKDKFNRKTTTGGSTIVTPVNTNVTNTAVVSQQTNPRTNDSTYRDSRFRTSYRT